MVSSFKEETCIRFLGTVRDLGQAKQYKKLDQSKSHELFHAHLPITGTAMARNLGVAHLARYIHSAQSFFASRAYGRVTIYFYLL